MEESILRWVKKGDFVKWYVCPKCGKRGLSEVVAIDVFEPVQSPFCPFCGERLRMALESK